MISYLWGCSEVVNYGLVHAMLLNSSLFSLHLEILTLLLLLFFHDLQPTLGSINYLYNKSLSSYVNCHERTESDPLLLLSSS